MSWVGAIVTDMTAERGLVVAARSVEVVLMACAPSAKVGRVNDHVPDAPTNVVPRMVVPS